MTSIFSHRDQPPFQSKNYQRYRPYIREDFCYCCAHCLMPEHLAAGERNFHLDHFKPKSHFPELRFEYSNLYYSCSVCNQNKGAKWPSSKLQEKGYRFIDTCIENFSSHFSEEDGKLVPLTPAAEYTQERLRLNSKHLVELRQMIKWLIYQLSETPLNLDEPLHSQVKPIFENGSQ